MNDAAENAAEWFAVQTKPGAEELAQQSLATLELETFLPRARSMRKRNRCVLPRIRPLFAGYCFARFQQDMHLHAVRYSRGVLRVVGTKERPWPVDETIIEEIRSRVADDGLVVLESHPFRRGELLRICSGPFEGWTGIFDCETDARLRVVILLHAIQQARVVMDRDCVESVEAN